MAQEKKYDVFISYSRKDSAIADEICGAFDQVGITYFIDRQGMGGTANYVTKIADEIDNSKAMLLLASANSYKSEYVSIELHYAFEQKIVVLPYALDKTQIPKDFKILLIRANWHYINEDPIVPKLLTSVSELVNKNIVFDVAKEKEKQIKTSPMTATNAELDRLRKEKELQERIAQAEAEKTAFDQEGTKKAWEQLSSTRMIISRTLDFYYKDKDFVGVRLSGLGKKSNKIEVKLPTSVEHENIIYPVTRIGVQAFKFCSSLVSISIPNTVKMIDSSAFWGCTSLISINIPDSVIYIAPGAFAGCTSLSSIALSHNLRKILYFAFAGCSFTSITIPNSVIEIGEEAFAGCESLREIRYNGTKQQWRKILKGKKWNKSIPAKVVRCTDGEVKLGGLFENLLEHL